MQIEINDLVPSGSLDRSCRPNRGQISSSIAKEIISEGCRWWSSDRSTGAKVAGENRMHEMLKIGEITGKSGMMFFNNYLRIIVNVPVILADPTGGKDI